MLTVTYKLTDMFFDRLKVKAMVDKKTHQFLYRAGGRVRTIAIRSMRRVGKKGKSSDPGQPPKWHGDTNFSLRKILFGFDGRNSVIVGPVLGNAKVYGADSVPALHEFGGHQIVREKRVGKSWVPMGRQKARPGQPTRWRQAKYPARPSMGPAVKVLKAKYSEYAKVWFGGGGHGTIGSAEAA